MSFPGSVERQQLSGMVFAFEGKAFRMGLDSP